MGQKVDAALIGVLLSAKEIIEQLPEAIDSAITAIQQQDYPTASAYVISLVTSLGIVADGLDTVFSAADQASDVEASGEIPADPSLN